jgi:hypothetical protein
VVTAPNVGPTSSFFTYIVANDKQLHMMRVMSRMEASKDGKTLGEIRHDQ